MTAKRLYFSLPLALAFLFSAISPTGLLAQGTAFSYQGYLNDGGAPANGTYDLQFTVYNAAFNGNVIGSSVTNFTTAVSNGLFAVRISFGAGIFDGSPRWLQIGVRTNGAVTFDNLSPLQRFLSTPYAIQAANATTATVALSANSVMATNVSGALSVSQLPAAIVTNGQSGVTLSGTFNGSSSLGTGIATNRGTGNLNGLTNLHLYVTGQGSGGAWFTNEGTPSSFPAISLDFWGQNATNSSAISWSSAPGDLAWATIFNNANHGNGTAGQSELEMLSAGRIALIPNGLAQPGGSGDGSLQIGVAAFQANMYLQHMLYGVGGTNAAWSVPLHFAAEYISNNVFIDEKEPGIFSRYLSGRTEWQLQKFADFGGSAFYNPDSFLVTAYDFWGTNATPALYWGTVLSGGTQSASNNIEIDTNGINLSIPGGLNGFRLNTTHPQLLFSDADLLAASAGDISQAFEVADGSGGLGSINTYFKSGPGIGGSFFGKGGVAIGRVGVPTNSSYALEVDGISSIPTNAAPLLTVSNFNPTLAKLYTNLSGGRITMRIPFTLTWGNSGAGAASEALIIGLTNSAGIDESLMYSNWSQAGLGFTNSQNYNESVSIGAGDYFILQTTGSGGASQVGTGVIRWKNTD